MHLLTSPWQETAKPRIDSSKRLKEDVSVHLVDNVFNLFFLLPDSLPRFMAVPQKVFDTELKKSFAHFNEGRIPVSVLLNILI